MATSTQSARRSVRLTGDIMQINLGKHETRYRLEPLPSGWGLALRCVKVGGTRKSDSDGAVYDLVVDPIEGQHQCSCIAFSKSSTCRHTEAALALLAHGKLSQ